MDVQMDLQPITDLQVKNILVLADFSACSQKALLYAVNIARLHKSKLTVLHIVSPRPGMAQDPRRDEAVRAAWGEMKKREADVFSKGVSRDIPYQLLVRRGKTWNVISRIVKLQNSDLIVIGAHGRAGLEKLILGSFAQEVFRQAPCPVLTVGPSIPNQAVSESPQHILFPTDGSHASKTAEPYAYQLGRAPGAQLTLLSVFHTGLLSNGNSGGDDQRLQRAKEHLQATGLYAAWRQGGVTPSVVVEMGSKVKTILHAADATGADLIILGISAKNNAPEKFEWADAYQVVCSAHCPVLTVRNTFPDPYFKRLLEMEPVRVGGKSRGMEATDRQQNERITL
jgi:nucleotide-binding universal stress UspA family protein